MKKNEPFFVFIVTIFSIIIIIVNDRYNFLDLSWKFFFMILIFLYNGYELIKNKTHRNEKNIK